MGRALARSDDLVPGGHPVLVLSYECWRGRFGADPQIVGRTGEDQRSAIHHSRRHASRIPRHGAPAGSRSLGADDDGGTHRVGERLAGAAQNAEHISHGKAGTDVSADQAEASLNAIAAELGREHPDTHEGMRIALSPPGLAGTLLRGPVIGFSGALLAVASLVLLLMCTNLTGLLLARSTDRRRETAIRLALGAGRSDLIRRSLVESGLLSLAGAAVALLLAQWLAAVLTGWRPPTDVPRPRTSRSIIACWPTRWRSRCCRRSWWRSCRRSKIPAQTSCLH